MKRANVAAAAVLAGAIQLQRESKPAECANLACAREQAAIMPEQPHALEEAPDTTGPEDFVELLTSPPALVKRGSPEHLEWLRENGMEFSAD